MQQTLDVNQQEFKALLDRSTKMVLDLFENVSELKGYHDFPQPEVASWFDEPIPTKGMDFDALLDEVKTKVLDTATGNLGPHMYAYVMAGGTQVSIVAEKLAATINQNLGKWHLGHASNEIEKRVAQWIGQALGYTDHAAGVMVSGGSAANLAGLTVARNIFFEKLQIRKKGLFGIKPFTVYASKEVHGCVDKSLELLGIGSNQLRKITCNTDFTINLEALKAQIAQDKADGFMPFCIVGSAGTVNTGAVDDFIALA
ncbi:MAG: pyridoxal-dependent decarboxylase, partial [Bacteroidota bacterium]